MRRSAVRRGLGAHPPNGDWLGLSVRVALLRALRKACTPPQTRMPLTHGHIVAPPPAQTAATAAARASQQQQQARPVAQPLTAAAAGAAASGAGGALPVDFFDSQPKRVGAACDTRDDAPTAPAHAWGNVARPPPLKCACCLAQARNHMGTRSPQPPTARALPPGSGPRGSSSAGGASSAPGRGGGARTASRRAWHGAACRDAGGLL